MDTVRRTFGATKGQRVELGAGLTRMSAPFPDVLAADVVPGVGLDRVLDVQDIDLSDGSVRALYGQNCFHDFPDPLRFLREAERVLAPGGGIVLIEAYLGRDASALPLKTQVACDVVIGVTLQLVFVVAISLFSFTVLRTAIFHDPGAGGS